MDYYNVNPIVTSLNSYKPTFSGDIDKSHVLQISTAKENEQSAEVISKNYADATRAMAMAQILSGTHIKPNMTQKEYVEKLIKSGKIINKDFYVNGNVSGALNVVFEVNEKGERVKEISFFDGGDIGCKFYNPSTQKVYKSLETLDGKLHVSYNQGETEEPLLDELYSQDGSLKSHYFYKK